MKEQTITERADLVIRRMVLEPGEATQWHTDTCHRFSVVVQGTNLAIEYEDTGEIHAFDVHPGMADWEAPQTRVHRAINTGATTFEEVVTFYRSGSDVVPQPAATPSAIGDRDT